MAKKLIRRKLLPWLVILIFIACGRGGQDAVNDLFTQYNGRYMLYISKSNFTLTVYEKGKGAVISYKTGFGSNEDMLPKLYEGDNRTPEGVYQVNEILSMDSAKETESYRKLEKMNEHYFKKSGGYHKFAKPDEDLGDNAYGPRYYGINYPNNNDIKRYTEALQKGGIPSVNGSPARIGSGIAIHGNNDEESIGHLCSSGCMRMYNNDIVAIEKYITLGTPVIIGRD